MKIDCPPIERYDPPKGALEFAKKRTKGLKVFWAAWGENGLDDLCAWCYMQAMQDISQCDLSQLYEITERKDDGSK